MRKAFMNLKALIFIFVIRNLKIKTRNKRRDS